MTRRPTPPQDLSLPREKQTYKPGELPAGPPGSWYDYAFRIWRFPTFDESKYGRPRDRFRSWEDDKRV